MKKLKIFAILLIISISAGIFSGCTSGGVSLFFTNFPSKLAYQVGEKLELKGMKVERLNTDGTNTQIMVDEKDIEVEDMSTPGEKKVKIKKENISTTFSIYVANIVVENKQDIKQSIANANDGDIIYIKQGEYKPTDNYDEDLFNILIDKKLTIIGDGSGKTIIHGNFIVGATMVGEDFIGLAGFEGVKFINLGLKLDSKAENRYFEFEGPYGNYDVFGAIKTFNSSKILINNCSFDGYCYGFLGDAIDNLTIVNNKFRNIKINAVRINQNLKNSSIVKNAFMDIGESSLVMENGKQGNVGALYLAFSQKENVGVIVSNNTFVRIGLKNGKMMYCNAGADELETQKDIVLSKASYVNNSAIIFLVSAAENNLEVGGIILSTNNFGTTLENISFGTNPDNLINQTGVYIIET